MSKELKYSLIIGIAKLRESTPHTYIGYKRKDFLNM